MNEPSSERRLHPGVYHDGRGGLQVDVTEFLASHGHPATTENVMALTEALAKVAVQQNIRVELHNREAQ